MYKGQGENPIHICRYYGERDWDDVEIEVYNQHPPHRFNQLASGAEALHQVIPLIAGRTLGMTLCPRRDDSGVVKMGLGVVKDLAY